VDNEFSGKTALVTGASRGIGAATAIALARQGVKNFLLQYNTYPEGASRTCDEIRALGGEARAARPI
jgi:3-oxoacyl-[acyl-carrier protein] reductase